jgi:hypothetical protein
MKPAQFWILGLSFHFVSFLNDIFVMLIALLFHHEKLALNPSLAWSSYLMLRQPQQK